MLKQIYIDDKLYDLDSIEQLYGVRNCADLIKKIRLQELNKKCQRFEDIMFFNKVFNFNNITTTIN